VVEGLLGAGLSRVLVRRLEVRTATLAAILIFTVVTSFLVAFGLGLPGRESATYRSFISDDAGTRGSLPGNSPENSEARSADGGSQVASANGTEALERRAGAGASAHAREVRAQRTGLPTSLGYWGPADSAARPDPALATRSADALRAAVKPRPIASPEGLGEPIAAMPPKAKPSPAVPEAKAATPAGRKRFRVKVRSKASEAELRAFDRYIFEHLGHHCVGEEDPRQNGQMLYRVYLATSFEDEDEANRILREVRTLQYRKSGDYFKDAYRVDPRRAGQ